MSQAYQRVLGRVPCPRCRRKNVPVMVNFKLYVHPNPDRSGVDCYGSPPELVFTAMLRKHGLDARQDNEQTEFLEGVDYDADPVLDASQAHRNKVALRKIVQQHVSQASSTRTTTAGGESSGTARP